jgi:hypothetical protein
MTRAVAEALSPRIERSKEKLSREQRERQGSLLDAKELVLVRLLEVGVAARDRGAVEFQLDDELIDDRVAEHP